MTRLHDRGWGYWAILLGLGAFLWVGLVGLLTGGC